MTNASTIAGRVIGTEDATPLEFWVAVAEGQFLQLDDVLALERELPNGEKVAIYGLVTQVRAYASFLLYSLFTSEVLGTDSLNTKALVYNVKGEDLLFFDHSNAGLQDRERQKYEKLGLKSEAFKSVELWAPPRRGDRTAAPDVATRHTGVTSYFWTLEEFCHGNLLPFLFTDAEDDRQQYTIVIQNVAARLRDVEPAGEGGVKIEGREVRTFRELVKLLAESKRAHATSPTPSTA